MNILENDYERFLVRQVDPSRTRLSIGRSAGGRGTRESHCAVRLVFLREVIVLASRNPR